MGRYVRKFYISDSHFGHEAIIGHCSRPFPSTSAMDDAMIDAWNSVVCNQDLVYHLGDFSVPDIQYADYIFSRLNGRKILVLGNHDECRPGRIAKHIEGLPWDRPPVQTMSTTDTTADGKKVTVFLSHYAHRTWPGAHHGSYHFYGHCHGSIPHVGNSRDVGVDLEDVAFKPRTFVELTKCLPGLRTAAF